MRLMKYDLSSFELLIMNPHDHRYFYFRLLLAWMTEKLHFQHSSEHMFNYRELAFQNLADDNFLQIVGEMKKY